MRGIAILLAVCFSLSVSAQRLRCDSVVTRDCEFMLDSISKINGELRTKLFLSEYKVEKVRFYLGITDRKPAQVRFLRGWIRRAIE